MLTVLRRFGDFVSYICIEENVGVTTEIFIQRFLSSFISEITISFLKNFYNMAIEGNF